MYLYYPQLKKRRRGKHDCNSNKDLSTLTSLLQQQQADYSHSIGGTSYYVALVNDKILIGDTHMIWSFQNRRYIDTCSYTVA